MKPTAFIVFSIIFLSTIALVFGCNASKAELSNRVIKTEMPENLVIFGTKDAAKLKDLTMNTIIDINKNSIIAIFHKIPSYLENEYIRINDNTQKKNQIGNIIRDINEYYYQCYAYARNGKNYVYINAFNNKALNNEYWKTDIVFVLDGGEFAWSVNYCLTDDKFEDISINGYS